MSSTRINKVYDVVICGAGPAGLFAAMELARTNSSILLLEQVKRLHDTRNVSNGWMGGSAKSDLRLFVDPGFGGSINDQWATEAMLTHIEENSKSKIKRTKDKLPAKFIRHLADNDVNVYEPTAYIIGSDKLTQIENSFQSKLTDKITIKSNSRIDSIKKENDIFSIMAGDKPYFAKKCILAMGRGGANWLINTAPNLVLSYTDDNFDLGIRLEFPHSLIREITKKSSTFRMNFLNYRTTAFTTKGFIEMENVDEFKSSNARSIVGKSTHHTSFALLKTFEQPNALQKALRLVQIANILADGQLIKEPASKLLTDTSVLSPIKEYASLKDGLRKIFDIIPQIEARCNIYAPEARLNTVKFDLSSNMETAIQGLYITGDMSGQTKSFGQSACSGLIAARHIINL